MVQASRRPFVKGLSRILLDFCHPRPAGAGGDEALAYTKLSRYRACSQLGRKFESLVGRDGPNQLWKADLWGGCRDSNQLNRCCCPRGGSAMLRLNIHNPHRRPGFVHMDGRRRLRDAHIARQVLRLNPDVHRGWTAGPQRPLVLAGVVQVRADGPPGTICLLGVRNRDRLVL